MATKDIHPGLKKAITIEVDKKLKASDHKYKVIELEKPKGEPVLLDIAAEYAFTQEPDTGFLIFSIPQQPKDGIGTDASKKLFYWCRSGKDLTAGDWTRHIMKFVEGTFDYHIRNDDENNMSAECANVEYVGKMRDAFTSHGIDLLRQKKLIDDTEEDFVIDLEANGIESW